MLYKLCRFLARSDIFFYLILWLMLLLIVGTIAEQQQGLYYAQQTYFSVYFFFLFGFIPLPGTYTILSAIFINLLCKLISDKWQTANLGSLVTHISGLLLLLGGFLTAHFSQEGYMSITENTTANYMSDYYDLELVVTNPNLNNPDLIFNNQEIKIDNILSNNLLPFKIKITKYCSHCELSNQQLKPLPKPKDNEQAETIIGININHSNANHETIYLKHDDPTPHKFIINNMGIYYLKLRHKVTTLPFAIKLNKFTENLHPGTNIAKEYKSEVTLTDLKNPKTPTVMWHGIISMNQPLRYKGYTFYQSSFYNENNQYTTILATVYNVGQNFPYIASIILCIGLLIHLIQKIPRLIKKSEANLILAIIPIMFLVITQNNSCYAQDLNKSLDYSTLKTLPVLHDGRIKPLDSFARIVLKSIANKETVNNISAGQWLINLMFNPKNDYNNPIFYISNPDLYNILNLKKKHLPYYSFKEILPGIKQNINIISKLETMPNNKDFTLAENQLINLYHNILTYFDLSRCLSLLIPQFNFAELQVAINFKSDNKQHLISYYQLLPYKQIISNKVTQIFADNKIDHINFNTLNQQTKIILTIADLFKKIQADKINTYFRIIPNTQYSNKNNILNNNWLAPWEAISSGHGSPNSAKYLDLLQELIYSYYNNDIPKWNKYSEALKNFAITHTAISSSTMQNQALTLSRQLSTEYYYNNLKPLNKTILLYILALILSGFILIKYGYNTNIKNHKFYNIIKNTASVLFIIGLLCHIISILMRIYILQRPPVANLYESILFVSVITAILSMMIEFFRNDNLGTLLGSLICTILQFITNSYAQTGDSLVVLLAVLNNNFWLGTHVVVITAGYGCCLILSALAHIYLFKLNLNNRSEQILKYILAFTLLSLFFTLLGTILGGIWADQSWGRFWGWDPKENGALLICLWLIAILHGRLSGHLNDLFFACLAAMTSITVMLAWFGVNLLSTGLHSYGFTENIATNLILFIIFELVLIIGLGIISIKANKLKKQHNMKHKS